MELKNPTFWTLGSPSFKNGLLDFRHTDLPLPDSIYPRFQKTNTSKLRKHTASQPAQQLHSNYTMTNSISTLRSYTYSDITPPQTVQDFVIHKQGHWDDVPAHELDKAPVYVVSHCWWNAMVNKDNYYSKEGKRLRLVFGSMSVEGRVLYGSEDNTEEDWLNMLTKEPKEGERERGLDAHCWLEDDEGNIYDKFFAEYELIAMFGKDSKMSIRDKLALQRGKRILKKARLDEAYDGWSPKDLYNKRGVSYKSMGKRASAVFLASLLKLRLTEVYPPSVVHNTMMDYVFADTGRLLGF